MKTSVKKGLGTVIWLLAMIIILGGALAFALNPSPAKSIFGYRVYEVLSGSMTPALRTGELALVQITPPQDIAIGDIVTYAVSPDGATVVTHRVVDKTTDSEGQTVFSFGDAADTIDTMFRQQLLSALSADISPFSAISSALSVLILSQA